MADRDFSGALRTIGGKVRVVMCHILVQSTSATIIRVDTLAAITHPLVASVVRNSAGNYTLTLRDAYKACHHASAHYVAVEETVDLYAQLSAAGGVIVANLGTSTPATVTVRLKTAGTNTDPSASGGVIEVKLVLEDSGAYTV